MRVLVIGDSITYLVGRTYGTEFVHEGVEFILDGDPGDRASNPSRYQALKSQIDSRLPTAAFYALGTNDVMKETFLDPERTEDSSALTLSKQELAETVGSISQALFYVQTMGIQPGWINVTERTMSGYYNGGARRLNAAMAEACAENDWLYFDWNTLRAPTTDLIHPKIEGRTMWVEGLHSVVTD